MRYFLKHIVLPLSLFTLSYLSNSIAQALPPDQVVPFSIFNDKEYISIPDNFIIFHQTPDDTDFTDILIQLNKGDFSPDKGNRITQADKAYWAYLKVNNPSDQLYDFVFFTGFINFIEVYLIKDGKIIAHKKNGQYVASSEKEIIKGRVSPVSLPIPPQTNYEILIRHQNINGRPIHFDPLLVDKLYWVTETSTWRMWDAAFFGILFIMVLYNLFLFITGKDKTYLYYSFYITQVALYIFIFKGFSREFILGEYPMLEPYLWTAAASLIAVFYLLFIKYYQDTKHLAPKWNNIISLAIVGILISLLIQWSILFFTFDIYLAGYISISAFLIETTFTYLLLYRLYLTKNPLVTYIIFGSLCLSFGVIIGVYTTFVENDFFLGLLYGQVAVVIELLVFSLGLGFRMKQNEKQKINFQHQLIDQLRENEQLQRKVNRELEAKVQERTQEVIAQKEEIEAQQTNIINKNQQLETFNQDLKNINEEKNHIIGIIAHDLRNPLTSALTMSQLLQSDTDELNEDQEECVSVLHNALERMNSMIHRILDIRSVEKREINLEKRPTPIHHLLTNVIDSFQTQSFKKQITIEAHFCPENPTLLLDSGYTIQIFENLISNALKFSHQRKTIFIKTKITDNKCLVMVQDQGPGISNEDQKKLFRKYQKLSATPTAGEDSTGLGLSIVKKYVDALDGQIFCESQLGSGTTFVVAWKR